MNSQACSLLRPIRGGARAALRRGPRGWPPGMRVQPLLEDEALVLGARYDKLDYQPTTGPRYQDKTGTVQDIVAAVLYLTDSAYVSGTIMAVDGGAAAGVW